MESLEENVTKAIVKMSLLALAAAYDSDSDLSNSEDEKVEREVNKGEDLVPPLKRGLDQVFDKEMKKEMGDGVGMVKPDSKKTKNIEKEQNPEESFNLLFQKRNQRTSMVSLNRYRDLLLVLFH